MPPNVLTPEHRRRMAEIFKGRIVNEETRQKIRIAKLGKKMPSRTPEYRRKLSEALKLCRSEGRHRLLTFTSEQKKRASVSLSRVIRRYLKNLSREEYLARCKSNRKGTMAGAKAVEEKWEEWRRG